MGSQNNHKQLSHLIFYISHRTVGKERGGEGWFLVSSLACSLVLWVELGGAETGYSVLEEDNIFHAVN